MSAPAGETGKGYGAGARILSIGLAITGVVTFAFFSLASHALEDVEYQRVTLLWTLTFIVCTVIYRPIEQLLARSVAESRARGDVKHSLRTPALLQLGSAITFVAVAMIFRDTLQNQVFGGDAEIYWILVGAVVAYAVSYFARGWLAGSGRPELYGGLVFIESSARCLFPIVALLGFTHGTLAVSLGIAAAPLLSLAVVPIALRGRGANRAVSATNAPRDAAGESRAAAFSTLAADTEELSPDGSPGESFPADVKLPPGGVSGPMSTRASAAFAGSVVVIMAAEQTLISAGVITEGTGVAALAATGGVAAAIFNAFLVVRAPLQLFQAVQSTLLPHLATLRASGDADAAAKALRQTLLAIGVFAAAVTLGLLVLGPWAMSDVLFDLEWTYSGTTLALVGIGMGLHLAAGTLNQSALAHGRAPVASLVWLVAAAFFVTWMLTEPVAEPVARAASGYAIASALLLLGLLALESRSLRTSGAAPTTAP